MIDILEKVVKVLDEKSATEINVINVGSVSAIADYFIIATGNNPRHMHALVDYTEDAFAQVSMHAIRKEGFKSEDWVLLDYGDIMVHIFSQETRNRYKLDKIWADAKNVELSIDFDKYSR